MYIIENNLLRARRVHGQIRALKRHLNLRRPHEKLRIAHPSCHLLGQGAWSPRHSGPSLLLRRQAVISVA
jgi:hypothetical protein